MTTHLDSIKKNAKKILWECERVERLEKAVSQLKADDFQRIEFWSDFHHSVYIRFEDLPKENKRELQTLVTNYLSKFI